MFTCFRMCAKFRYKLRVCAELLVGSLGSKLVALDDCRLHSSSCSSRGLQVIVEFYSADCVPVLRGCNLWAIQAACETLAWDCSVKVCEVFWRFSEVALKHRESFPKLSETCLKLFCNFLKLLWNVWNCSETFLKLFWNCLKLVWKLSGAPQRQDDSPLSAAAVARASEVPQAFSWMQSSKMQIVPMSEMFMKISKHLDTFWKRLQLCRVQLLCNFHAPFLELLVFLKRVCDQSISKQMRKQWQRDWNDADCRVHCQRARPGSILLDMPARWTVNFNSCADCARELSPLFLTSLVTCLTLVWSVAEMFLGFVWSWLGLMMLRLCKAWRVSVQRSQNAKRRQDATHF
jgi:hypothetical protein